MTAPSSLSLIARLRRLSTSAVSDVLDHCGYREQSIASAFAPLDRAAKLAGVAACLEGVSEDSSNRAPALSSFEIDRRMAEGAVLVIAMNGHRASAAVGGLMCLAARRRGCGGFVVDGGVRDAPEIVELGVPAFCRYVTPLNSGGRWHLTRADVDIALPGQVSSGVVVSPDDFLIGDGDGLIAIPRDRGAGHRVDRAAGGHRAGDQPAHRRRRHARGSLRGASALHAYRPAERLAG